MADAMEERLQDDPHPILRIIYTTKRDVLYAIADGEAAQGSIKRNCDAALRGEMNLSTYLKVQSARNAAEWVDENLETL